MIQPIHLYIFRTFSVFIIIGLAFTPLIVNSTIVSAFALIPLLMVLSLSVMAVVEQKLLHMVNWQESSSVKVHKASLKPVRHRKQAGCRLLGLACAT